MESGVGFPNPIVTFAFDKLISWPGMIRMLFTAKDYWRIIMLGMLESSVPPINVSLSFSVLDTRISAFGVETQTGTRDEQI